MRHYALIGETLGHSLSAPIHRFFFEETGLTADYDLIELPIANLAGLLNWARKGYLDGLNATIPYKKAVIPLLDGVDEEARRIGAVNVVRREGGRLTGHNSDAYGFAALLRHGGIDPAGAVCAVLGASGGAAGAVIDALRSGGAARIYLVSRGAAGRQAPFARGEWIDYEALNDVRADLLVNCTPVGMAPSAEASPLPRQTVQRMGAAVDLIYNPAETPLLRDAREAGRAAVNGLYMLVAQAVRAQEIWQGQAYPPALTEKIYARLVQALKEGRA